ncbi:MAG: hypothetical protein R2828_08850 [Saprospiraceae bacterium]
MKRFLTLLLTCLSYFAYGQTNYVTGHVVTKKGETIQGEINYKEWVVNPRKISFRTEEGVQVYTPNDLKTFKIDAKNEIYESAIVLVNRESLEWEEMPQFQLYSDVDMTIEMHIDTVFLLTLAKGKMNLYQLIDENKRLHFYFQKTGGQKEPLIYRAVKIMRPGLLGSTDFTIDPNLPRSIFFEDYKGQLKLAMYECEGLTNAIDKLTYSRSILDMVQQYNECTGQSFYIKPKDKAESFIYGFGGTAQTFITIKDVINNPAAGKMSPTWSSTAGLGMEFGIPRSRKKFSWMIEALYMSGKAELVTTSMPPDLGSKNVEYRADLKGFRFNGILKYAIFTGTVQPYLKFGVGGASYSRRDFWVKDLSLSVTQKHTLLKSEVVAIGGFGVKVYNFFVEGRYDTANDINRVTDFDLKMRRVSFLAGYALPLNRPTSN